MHTNSHVVLRARFAVVNVNCGWRACGSQGRRRSIASTDGAVEWGGSRPPSLHSRWHACMHVMRHADRRKYRKVEKFLDNTADYAQ